MPVRRVFLEAHLGAQQILPDQLLYKEVMRLACGKAVRARALEGVAVDATRDALRDGVERGIIQMIQLVAI